MDGKVVVFYLSAGGGHRAAARAIAASAAVRHPGLEVALHDLADVMLPLDPVRRVFGIRGDDLYNGMVQRGMTLGLVPQLRVLQALIKLRRRALSACIARFLAVQQPTTVLSVLPNFNAVLRDAVRQALPNVPFAVALTDFADFPPNFWLVPDVDRVLVSTDEAAHQAQGAGLAAAVRRTSGMIIDPNAHRRDTLGPRAARAALGLREDAFTVLCLFGGKGAPEMAPLAEALLSADPRWTVVAIAGQNERLERRLRVLEAGARGRLRAYGFTHEVGRLMAASDVLLTKPGPGTLAEAFHHGLPAVVTRNAFTIPQERFNAGMLAAHEFGASVRHWREMPSAALQLQKDAARLAAMRARLLRLPPNRAVEEVADEMAALARRA